MASITPTIGRKVYYNPRGQDHIAKYDDQPLDATIIYVWPKLDQSNPFDLVNLFIVDHAGGMSMRAHVPLVQDGQEAPLAGHYVEWVPYQKGQAKAAEIPNVVAGSASQEVPPSGPTESVTSASSVANPEASPLPNESAPMPDSGSPQVSSSEPQPPITSEATPTSTNGDFGSPYQPHQQRVVDEKSELDGKLEKLQLFFSSVTFIGLSGAEQSRLQAQAGVMRAYSFILGERIAAF